MTEYDCPYVTDENYELAGRVRLASMDAEPGRTRQRHGHRGRLWTAVIHNAT